MQSEPEYTSGYTTEFTYKKIEYTDVNATDETSKIIYEDNDAYSDYLRNEILEKMGQYFLFKNEKYKSETKKQRYIVWD